MATQRTLTSFFRRVQKTPSGVSPDLESPTVTSSRTDSAAQIVPEETSRARGRGSNGKEDLSKDASDVLLSRKRSALLLFANDDDDSGDQDDHSRPPKQQKCEKHVHVAPAIHSDTNGDVPDYCSTYSPSTQNPEHFPRGQQRPPISEFALNSNRSLSPNRERPVGAEVVAKLRDPRKKGELKVKASKNPKYTPLEQQVLELKSQNPSLLLLIEVGYKFRFFGEDAHTASKVLNIGSFLDHAMYTASIPVHRLHVHVSRLVKAGYKVGVVRQTETAALKKESDSRNKTFSRSVTDVYSRATFLHEDGTDCGSILTLAEKSQANSRVKIGLTSVNIQTGKVITDHIIDGVLREKLEAYLILTSPSEVLLPSDVSLTTKRVIKAFLERQTGSRLEDLPDRLDYNAALKRLSELYKGKKKGLSQGNSKVSHAQDLFQSPALQLISLAYMAKHLASYSLGSMLFNPSSSLPGCSLSATTLAHLEIFQNRSSSSQEGTLYSLVNKTATKFGGRLLRRWISNPLHSLQDIEQRLRAVDELALSPEWVKDMREMLRAFPDLETVLSRIQCQRATVGDIYNFLDSLCNLEDIPTPEHNSLLLNPDFSGACGIASRFRQLLRHEATATTDMFNLESQSERFATLCDLKEDIESVEERLASFLPKISQQVGFTVDEYATCGGVEYLIQVPKQTSVPSGWVKMSATKTVARYHTPRITKMLHDRECARERFKFEADRVLKEYCEDLVDEGYIEFRATIEALAVIDCLLAYRCLADMPGYCRPNIETGNTVTIEAKQARHPTIETFTLNYTPNDVHIDGTIAITGPNMGGKSSYAKMVAMIVLLAQIGCYVPAESYHQRGLVECILTRMGASDNLFLGHSTFYTEILETKAILAGAGPRSLVVLDELGRGTSTHDGAAIAYAVLTHLAHSIKCPTLFVTHYTHVLSGLKVFRMHHPGFQLKPGIADRSYAEHVAREAGVDEGIVARGMEISLRLEERQRRRGMFCRLWPILQGAI